MKKRLQTTFAFFAAIIMLFSAQLSAQNMHIIGTGTIESHYPPNNQVFEYGWSTMLYTSDEVGEAKSITKIAFDQTTDYAGYWEYAVLENQKVYIKQSEISNFGSLAYEDPQNPDNGYTLIYSGTMQFNLGWTEIILPNTFEYDGTSSLIVHWENHRATTAPIVNVKFNASEVTDNVFKALGGDGSFPTAFGTYITDRPNIAIYYNGDGPGTPVNPYPANNSIKALVDTEIEFLIGDNTTSYNVYFGTTNPPTELLVEGATVSTPGNYSCNPSELLGDFLSSYTNYFWQVEAKDGTVSTYSAVWNFTTQGVWEEFPYATSFEDQPIRTLFADTVDWSWPLSGVANWRMMDFSTHTGNYAVGCNIWGEYTDNYSLVSPRMYLPENHRVNFWWKISNGDASEIDVFFEITTDGGQNWEMLYEFRPDAAMEDYDQLLINLASYAGNNVYLRWRFESFGNYTPDYFFLDDLTIEPGPNGAIIQISEPVVTFPDLAIGGSTYLPLEISNIGSAELLITGSTITAPYSVEFPDAIASGESAIVNITMDATAQGDFNQNFDFTGEFTGNSSVELQGSVYHVSYSFFENADVSLELPLNWSVIRTLDPYDIYTNVDIKATVYDSHSAPNVFRMIKMNDTISPLMFITEGVSAYGSNKLTFYAKKSYDDYDAILEVGTTTDPLHSEPFAAVQSFVMTTEYQKIEMEFPSSTTDPYIVFNFLGGRYASVIWIDDIEWDMQGNYPPYCPIITYPVANAEDIDVMTGLELNWTSGGGNPTGFKLFLGTDSEASNIINGKELGDVLSYTFIDDPVYGEKYYWRVEAYNDYGESTDCSTNNFIIMDNPMVEVPYSENFDGIDAFGSREYPLGWSIDNANNDNFPWDIISDIATPGVAHSTPNAMHMLFALNTMDDYLFTPPVAMVAGTSYELTFWYRTMGDQWVPYPVERMKVLLGNDNVGVSMTTEIYNNESIVNQEWEKAKVTFTVENDGEYFVGFYGYSEPNQGLLLLDDVAIISYASVGDYTEDIVSIYPNPAVDRVQVTSKEMINTIQIIGLDGSVVYQITPKQKDIAIGIDDLENGLYIISIETESGIAREKLIIH